MRRTPTARGSWHDPRSGVVEESTFLDVGAGRIIAFAHIPPGPARTGVLLCSSLYEDLQVNYRRELLLARELSGHGVAAVRFHYRGTGNSDDLRSAAVTFDSLVEDATVAEGWLRERTGVSRVAYYGAKLGALVGAHMADRSGPAPVVLCAPALSGVDYFKGMSRAGRVAGVSTQQPLGHRHGGLEETLARDGFAEILGNRVFRDSYEDLGPRRLELNSAQGRPALLVQIGASETLSRPYQALADRLRGSGAELEILLVQARQLWFVPDTWEPEDEKPELRLLVSGIREWVDRVAARSP